MKYHLNNEWTLWYHNSKNNWKINGYTKLLNFKFLEEILYYLNNFDKLGGLYSSHFFFMKEKIKPVWEDPNNIGCISIKSSIKDSVLLWEKKSCYII